MREVCIVTGGSNGIGRAIVQAFLFEERASSSHCVVYNLDLQPPPTDNTVTSDAAAAAALSSNRHDQHSLYRRVDVADGVAFTKALRQIWQDEHAQLAPDEELHVCLVNNAGVFETAENKNVVWDETTTPTQIHTIVQTNLGSVVHGTRTMVRLFKDNPTTNMTTTTIINMASTAAFGPFPQHPLYAATKAAILSFTQTAQVDFQSQYPRLRIYAVCPGIIDTPMGRMGGAANAAAVAQLSGGKRTSPQLVGVAVLRLFHRQYPQQHCSYLVVDNHQINTVAAPS